LEQHVLVRGLRTAGPGRDGATGQSEITDPGLPGTLGPYMHPSGTARKYAEHPNGRPELPRHGQGRRARTLRKWPLKSDLWVLHRCLVGSSLGIPFVVTRVT